MKGFVCRLVLVSSVLTLIVAGFAQAASIDEPIILKPVNTVSAGFDTVAVDSCAVSEGEWSYYVSYPHIGYLSIRLWVTEGGLSIDSLAVAGIYSDSGPCHAMFFSGRFVPPLPIKGTSPPDCIAYALEPCVVPTTNGWSVKVTFISPGEAEVLIYYWQPGYVNDTDIECITCYGRMKTLPIRMTTWGAIKQAYE